MSVVWATADGPRLPLVSRQNTELRALQGTSRGRCRVGRFRTNSQAQLSQRVWLGIQEKHPKMSIFVWFVLFVVHFFCHRSTQRGRPATKMLSATSAPPRESTHLGVTRRRGDRGELKVAATIIQQIASGSNPVKFAQADKLSSVRAIHGTVFA